MKKLAPILFLIFFPGIFAETIASANTPAVLFLSPKIFITFILVYGVPVLLIRELWVRRRVGLVGMVILGAVYAAFNEGLVAASWFKPHPLNFTNAAAARVGTVNFHLVINLMLFHTLFSVLIPIILSMILFKQFNGQPLLGKVGSTLWTLAVIFLALANVGHGTLAHPKVDLLILMLMAVAVSFITKDRPAKLKNFTIKQPLLVGLAYSLVFTVSYFVLPNSMPGKSVVLSLALYVAMMIFTVRYLQSANLLSRQTLLLIIGSLIPAALISISRVAFGQPVVVAGCLVFLTMLLKRTDSKTPALSH